MGNGVPKMWSEFGLTNDQINTEFDKVKAREDPQKKGRIPMVGSKVHWIPSAEKYSFQKNQIDFEFKPKLSKFWIKAQR